MRLYLVPLGLVCAVGAFLACGGSDSNAIAPDGAGAAGAYPPIGQQTGAGAGPVTSTGSGPVAPPTESMAQALPPAAAGLATPIMQGVAAKDAQGMQPEGGSFAGNFQQGQILEQPFTIQPGKCYTVVAVGVNITELDAQIVAQPPVPGGPPIVLAQDSTTGPQAVVGGGGNCFRNPTPLAGPAKVVLRAVAGGGIALGQIFVK